MEDAKGDDPKLVSDATFKAEVLDASEPVLVDFFAEWCGPCKAMAPALKQFASEVKGKVKVVKLDVDQSSNTAQSVNIRAMPTLIIFKGGKEIGRHVGALVQKKSLADWVSGTIG
jgi:thioredoxin 1